MIKQLEEKMMELNAKLPALPEGLKAFIANILWIITIISIVLNILAILAICGIGTVGGLITLGTGHGLLTIKLILTILAGVIGMGITVVLEITAVKPLKDKQYRGWAIAFLVVWLQFLFSVISHIFFKPVYLIWTVIWTAISLYLLMQVREYFVN